jgi:hypothetical protein
MCFEPDDRLGMYDHKEIGQSIQVSDFVNAQLGPRFVPSEDTL